MPRVNKNKGSGGAVKSGAVRDLPGGFGPGTGLLLQVRCCAKADKIYYVAGTELGREFSLWEDIGGGKLTCVAVGDSPPELYDKIPW